MTLSEWELERMRAWTEMAEAFARNVDVMEHGERINTAAWVANLADSTLAEWEKRFPKPMTPAEFGKALREGKIRVKGTP